MTHHHRITTASKVHEPLTLDEARALHRRFDRKRLSHSWEAWCGERTGWNSVTRSDFEEERTTP